MIRSNTDLPYINNVLMAHRATNIVYHRGPAHKAKLVVPSSSLPSPQSAVIQTLRPIRPSLKAASKIYAAYEWRESTDREAAWCLQRRVRPNYGVDRPRDRSLRATEFKKRLDKETHCENDDGKDIARTVEIIHRGFCAAVFEDSEDDEDSLCDDSEIKGLDLKATTRWTICNGENPQEHQLTTTQLLMQESVLRNIVEQALKARRNGRMDSSIFSEETPEEEDKVLEIILEMMKFGQSTIDAGVLQGEEGGDIQMMVRNNFHTLMRKATRPFRPSGVKIVMAELSNCLDTFRQLRTRLLQEYPGMSMAEILEERSLDLRPR